MPDAKTCPTCGAPLPADGEPGTCPRCLLAAALDRGEGALPPAAPTPEDVAGHFPALEVLELLGQGGMGMVYRARQKALDREVALKILSPEMAREPGFAERFTREARTLARLQHPNIVGVHDFGESDGLYYLVMEYVDGTNLRQALRAQRLEPRQALAVVAQVCDALQYAHDRGVVHRDIKPENLLLDRAGQVKIADFGLAKLLRRAPVDVSLTRSGQVMGTLHYMAPEQYQSPDVVDHRADIYSLGVVFYEMLTGTLPLGSFPPPSHSADVDARLDHVVLRALERERDRRWQNASQVKDELTSISRPPDPAAAAEPREAPPSSPPREPAAGTVASRLSRLALAGALGVPAGVALGLLAGGIARLLGAGGDVAAQFGTSLCTATAIAGVVVSIAGWVAIRRSRGGLHGLPLAIPGSLVPPALLALFFLGSVVTLTRLEPPHAGPDGARVAGPGLDVEAGADDARTRVVGEASSVAPDVTVAEQEALWIGITRSLEPNPDVKALRLSPSERVRLAGMSADERGQAAAIRRLGLGFLDVASETGRAPERLRLAWVVLGPGEDRARVVRSDGLITIAYPVLREGGRWFPALGPVEIAQRAPEDGDRVGWLERVPGTPHDPASRVSGGPQGMSDTERALVAHVVALAWRQGQGERAAPGRPQVLEMRLHHVALDPTGKAGRIVMTDGRSTLATGVRFTSAFQCEVEGEDTQVRERPPLPEDRGGRLDR